MLNGIYFKLPFDLYLADAALGSGDVKMLRNNARRYWLGSALNPDPVARARFRTG